MKIPALMLSLFFIYGCTQKAVLNTQLPPEPIKLAETDSEGNFITAEYCFHPEFENDSTWEWDFSPYKITNPLNFKLPEMCEFGYSYSVEIDSKESLTLDFLGRLRGGTMGVTGPIRSHTGKGSNTGKQRKRGNAYKQSIESIFNVYPIGINYKEMGIPLLQKEDTAKILDLAGKSFPVKWKLDFRCKGKNVLDLQGIYYIRIYGVCTEEQLKIIEYGEDNE
jgi:hypothetical protein